MTPLKTAGTGREKLQLPPELKVEDHGSNCGNSVRYELYASNGVTDYRLIASIEEEDQKLAGKLAQTIADRYNSQPDLLAACKVILKWMECGTEAGRSNNMAVVRAAIAKTIPRGRKGEP